MSQDMNLDKQYPVAIHNDLIKAKSTLSLNEIKLLRLTIMQVLKDDTDFQTFTVKITDLAAMLGISGKNLYRDIDKIADNIMSEVLRIGDSITDESSKGVKAHWVDRIDYGNGIITIRLADVLKPYLLALKEHFTVYQIADVLTMKSVYSIRLYELIREELRNRLTPNNQKQNVYLPLDLIQHATDTEGKYRANMFAQRVIIPSVEEINDLHRGIGIESWTPRKEGRKIIGYDFVVTDYVTKLDHHARDVR